jgi:hydroxyacylglutathione hydrolase
MMPSSRNATASLQIHQIPCLEDNYGYLVHDAGSNLTATVDTPSAAAILEALALKGWRLDYILNTHHHDDHAGGNLELKAKTDCRIVGPKADAARIPGIDIALGEGDRFALGSHRATVLDTPGHTRGHIVFVFADDHAAFVGDTLFAMGCGRLFEGTPAQMWDSLQKLLRLPDETRVYCAHEYTQKNARFAVTVDPGNRELAERAAEVDRLRAMGLPTVPTTMGRERRTNPFLRPDDPGVRSAVGLAGAGPVEVFAELRRRRNVF